MIKATTELLNRIATHEAGHAVVAHVAGLRVAYVDLYEARTLVHDSESRYAMQAFCMGGWAAQEVMGIHDTEETLHKSTDYCQGMNDSLYTQFTNEQAIEYATRIVEEHKDQLVILRDKLLAQGYLDPADIKGVLK